jgi:dTDP-4-dehydrorhamnose 3,5-epimerase
VRNKANLISSDFCNLLRNAGLTQQAVLKPKYCASRVPGTTGRAPSNHGRELRCATVDAGAYAAGMDEEWRAAAISGVWRRRVRIERDDRGSFNELWRGSLTRLFPAWKVAQANLSRSRSGVLRGLHFHQHQTDLWTLLDGRAVVGLVDIRPLLRGSAERPPDRLTQTLAAGDSLLIPEGVAHGFWALEEVSFLYLVNREYDGSDELGFAWNDPLAGVRWPDGEPVLSDRDRNAPSLAEAIATARQLGQLSDG